jgi:hypothetical protein
MFLIVCLHKGNLNISGFIKMFSNVAHFTLDLSNNKLETLPADVLYDNASNWEHEGTQILKGSYQAVKTLKKTAIVPFVS